MSRLRAPLMGLALAVVWILPVAAQPADTDFKKLIEQGRYQELGQKLRTYLDLQKADPKLRAYLELNLQYLERGARSKFPGQEIILVRGAGNDKTYKMPATSGGSELFLPNTIRYMRSKWDPRLARIAKYFTDATTERGGNGKNLQELGKIIEHHKGGGLGTNANSTKSVLISASTTPQRSFGPPFYILKVAPERAIFNWKGLSSEREVLLPFWILPHEIVAKVNSYQEVLNHPAYKASKVKGVEFSSYGYSTGGTNANNWSIIENNIRSGRAPLEGLAGFNSYFPGQRGPVGPVAPNEYLQRFKERVAKRGGVVEMVGPADLRLPPTVRARTYLDAEGRPHVLLRKNTQPSKVALLDELTHVLQLKQLLKVQSKGQVEELLLKARAGDMQAKEIVNRFEIRAKKMVRGMVPGSDVATRDALTKSIASLQKEIDPYQKTRRSNGTIDWKKAEKQKIDWKKAGKQFGGGLGHFTLALFLKELAVVSRTGDSLLIEEFFQGLLTTDFYVHYGLFSFGAAGADLAYAKYLEKHVSKYVRPRFVNSVLRSQLALAVGMALPDLVTGKFEGRVFAINLAGLGLSSTAIKAGVAGIRWVANASRLSGGASFLGKLAKARKLTAVAGWVYTAAETAVVLYYGEKISRAIDERLERNRLQTKVKRAVAALIASPTTEGARARADAVTTAFREYRDFTSRPLFEAEGLLGARLGKLATETKQNDDAFKRMQETVRQKGLKSLGNAARRVAETRNEKFKEKAGRAIDAYENAFALAQKKVYREGEPVNPIENDANTRWVLRGSNPEESSGSALSRMGRGSARRALLDSVSDLDDARLAVYDQEAVLWAALAQAHDDDPHAAGFFKERERQTREVRTLDKNVVLGLGSKPVPVEEDPAEGILGALEKLEKADKERADKERAIREGE